MDSGSNPSSHTAPCSSALLGLARGPAVAVASSQRTRSIQFLATGVASLLQRLILNCSELDWHFCKTNMRWRQASFDLHDPLPDLQSIEVNILGALKKKRLPRGDDVRLMRQR